MFAVRYELLRKEMTVDEDLLGKPRGRKHNQLDAFREEVLRLREAGYSFEQIANWLADKKKVTVTSMTVSRFFRKNQ